MREFERDSDLAQRRPIERPLLAGKRPSNLAVATGTMRLDLRLLGDLQSIVNLYAETRCH